MTLQAGICPALADFLISLINFFSCCSSFVRSRSSSRCAFSRERWCCRNRSAGVRRLPKALDRYCQSSNAIQQMGIMLPLYDIHCQLSVCLTCVPRGRPDAGLMDAQYDCQSEVQAGRVRGWTHKTVNTHASRIHDCPASPERFFSSRPFTASPQFTSFEELHIDSYRTPIQHLYVEY